MIFDIVSIIIVATIFVAPAILIWLFVNHAKKDAQHLIEEIRKENIAAKENAADATPSSAEFEFLIYQPAVAAIELKTRPFVISFCQLFCVTPAIRQPQSKTFIFAITARMVSSGPIHFSIFSRIRSIISRTISFRKPNLMAKISHNRCSST